MPQKQDTTLSRNVLWAIALLGLLVITLINVMRPELQEKPLPAQTVPQVEENSEAEPATPAAEQEASPAAADEAVPVEESVLPEEIPSETTPDAPEAVIPEAVAPEAEDKAAEKDMREETHEEAAPDASEKEEKEDPPHAPLVDSPSTL